MCINIHIYVYLYTYINTQMRGRGREMYYKKLAHTIMEAGKSKICSVGLQPGDPGKPMLQFRSRGWQVETQEGSLLFGEAGLFVLFSPSTDCSL